jgi:hypothetical protein
LAGGLNFFAYVGNNPLGLVDPLGLEATAYTYQFGPAGSTYDVLLSGTHFLAPYYQKTPEAQDATRIHEDVYRYDPNQQSWAFWNRVPNEIDAYTKEMNYTKGRIARLKLQLQQLQQSDCPKKYEIAKIENQIKNYYDSIRNAQDYLSCYQSTNCFKDTFLP